MGAMTPDERREKGPLINGLRDRLTAALSDRRDALQASELEAKLASEGVDLSLPPPPRRKGSVHPTMQAMDEIVSIFADMGFQVAEGPDIEDDFHNFTALNFPPGHPAREMHDTFFLKPDPGTGERKVLRTHTSPVQARIMTTRKPPIRVICPGRVYRADEADATHSPVFHQMEGLVIDENITMGDLKGTLDEFARQMFGEGIQTRFRPSFFPFTEPSAEVDLTCANCKCAGCRMCKGTGWIEILGAGMVHPHVLEMNGFDPEKCSGFAFGVGLERIALLKYEIDDMRLLYENDARFLDQF
jgi:phenylalanyl-tRNA synthetase alpha chain